MNVHSHGPAEGRGLDCGENLIGHCMVEQIKQDAVAEYIRTKETAKVMINFEDPRMRAIIMAWVDAGSHPSYHREMQRKLRAEWPVLADALDNFIFTGS